MKAYPLEKTKFNVVNKAHTITTLNNHIRKNELNFKLKIFITVINHKKIKIEKRFDKYLYFCAENLNNKILISNFLFWLSKKFFNKYYILFPKFILKLPLWFPYKKHLKRLKIKNRYFVFTNTIKNKSKNIFIYPYFMYKFKEDYTRLYSKILTFKIDNNKKFCAFIVSNASNIERLDFYQRLSNYKKVDSFGKIFKNTKSFENKNKKTFFWQSNPEIYKDYKFVICFENSYEEEYVTEKLPNAMLGGAIPIYKGAPNVGKYFNTKSFINYDDYGSFDKMIEKIIELDKDDEKYLQFINQQWITPQNKKNIEQKEKEFEQFLDKVFKE